MSSPPPPQPPAQYVRCNSKFFAVSARGGGGPVLVMPYAATGKLPRGYPLINGQAGAVLDTAWSPFDDHILATGSDDATIKIWAIPEGGLTEALKEPVHTLLGHSKPVSLLQWNPVAADVLASVGKEPSVRVWDVVKGVAGVTLTGFGGLVQDLAWSANGAQLFTADKEKAAKLWDVRAGTVAAEWKPHAGGKPFKVLPLGATGQIVTVGFTAQAKREFKVWDAAKGFDAPLTTFDLDQSSGTLIPFYDEDTRMMYLTGKGDGNIRFFEFTDDAPYVHLLSEHRCARRAARARARDGERARARAAPHPPPPPSRAAPTFPSRARTWCPSAGSTSSAARSGACSSSRRRRWSRSPSRCRARRRPSRRTSSPTRMRASRP